MTKENREILYKHFRDLEGNYEASPHLDSGPTATPKVKERAKASADEMLKKHPELEVQVEPKPVEEEKPVKETKSKGKK